MSNATSSRRKRRRRLAAMAGLGAAVLTLAIPVVGYFLLDRVINDDRDKPKVLAAPPGALDPEVIEPYAGPHPGLLERPEETFAFPIGIAETGPVEPLHARVRAYPLLCRTVESDLGQPVVDNDQGYGMAVFAEDGEGGLTDRIVGYSKDCSLRTRIEYWRLPMRDEESPERVDGPGGEGPIVRVEVGTINRHIYQLVLPVGPGDRPEAPDLSAWNRRLIYQFRGGVGIGLRQGRANVDRLIGRRAEELHAGYAVAYSTGNQTSNHYNIALAEDTMARVKRQFETAYAVPEYTVGLGGSGGAIQQYLIAQNRPGLLDAAIPLYSFPDMVTQSIHVLDCEPVTRFFDVGASLPKFWAPVARRAEVLGLSSSEKLPERFYWFARGAELAAGRFPRLGAGATECTRSWRGMTPLVLNPHYAHFADRFVPALREAVRWSYWGDLKHYFGTDDAGYGRVTWDNVGVQYGLRALRAGKLAPEQFLELNRRVGGWLNPAAMEPVQLWLFDVARSSLAAFSPGDYRNLTAAHSDPGSVAPRSEGDLEAMWAAWRSGQVFAGRIDIPVIDLRHYLEPELDMHHTVASFSSRLRISRAMGHAEHQLIWSTRPPHLPYAVALDLVDRWLAAIRANPAAGVAANRPADAVDRCWAADGTVIAEGAGVWDGPWNGRPAGACMDRYPILSTPRLEAGAPYTGDVFKCALQPVAQALASGVYGDVDMAGHRAELERIFPAGVCDYRQPDQGLPAEIAAWFSAPAPDTSDPNAVSSRD